MSGEASELLHRFDALPLQERKQLSDLILRRAARFDYDEPSDEELTSAAARVFELLDQNENDTATR